MKLQSFFSTNLNTYWWLIYHDFVLQQRRGQVSKSCPLNTVTKRSIQYYMCTYYVSASLYVLLVHLSSLHFRYDRPRTSKYLDGKTRGQKNSKKQLCISCSTSLQPFFLIEGTNLITTLENVSNLQYKAWSCTVHQLIHAQTMHWGT